MFIRLKQHIGAKLKTARLRSGLTQDGLGERVGKTAESISNIERGAVLPPLDTLLRLFGELGEPIGYFVADFEPGRPVSRNRMEAEEQIRGLTRRCTDPELKLTLALLKAVLAQRPAS